MKNRSLPVRAGRLLLGLLFGAGILSGGLLLLSPVLTPPPEPGKAASPVSAPPAAPVEKPSVFRAGYLSPEDLDRGADPPADYDGVVVPMKGQSGALAYVSALPLAADCGASAAVPGRNEALRAMNGREGLHTVALVYCLRDEALTEAAPDLCLPRRSGSPWRDEGGQAWLDPAHPRVRAYLSGICRELTALGFDEILLADCAYPQGDEDLPPQEERQTCLEDLCRGLQQTLADSPVKLSVVGQDDWAQPEASSGQSAVLLASFPGRVWCRREDAAALRIFSPVLLPGEL